MTFINTIMWIAAICTVIASIYLYVQMKSKLTKNDENIKKLYKTLRTKIGNINKINDDFKYLLRDYYIASSYNSCCGGNFFFDNKLVLIQLLLLLYLFLLQDH